MNISRTKNDFSVQIENLSRTKDNFLAENHMLITFDKGEKVIIWYIFISYIGFIKNMP